MGVLNHRVKLGKLVSVMRGVVWCGVKCRDKRIWWRRHAKGEGESRGKDVVGERK